jgi:hypothetical protein
MTRIELFDSVKLTEAIALTDGGIAPPGTLGAVVEVFKEGKAYMVELFGDWVKYNAAENFVPANRQDAESFLETLAVEMVYPHQLQLVKPVEETVGVRARLAAVLDELSEDLLAEVQDFAEFLLQKRQRVK